MVRVSTIGFLSMSVDPFSHSKKADSDKLTQKPTAGAAPARPAKTQVLAIVGAVAVSSGIALLTFYLRRK